MDPSPCHLPYEPCLNGAKEQPAFFCPLSRARYVFQYPSELCPAEISVYQKTCLPAYHVAVPFCRQSVAVLGRPAALPHDSVIHRLSGILIPDYCSLSLISYAYSLYVLICTSYLQKRLLSHSHLSGPDLHRVVFHPSVLGILLSELFLSNAHHISFLIIDYTSGTGSPLIEGHNIFSHADASYGHIPYTKRAMILFDIFIPLYVSAI